MKFTFSFSGNRNPIRNNLWLWMFIVIFTIIWSITLIWTTNISNWLLENTLTFIFVAVFILTYKKYKFSDLSYMLICIFLCMHVYGAQYTYADNPFGYWLMDTFDLSRNHYDRIVHFSFGLLLAFPVRELFQPYIKKSKLLYWLLPVVFSLSVSGLYELIEWAVADIFFKDQGMDYLGTQGDIWDAQKDTFVALLGGMIGSGIVSVFSKT